VVYQPLNVDLIRHFVCLCGLCMKKRRFVCLWLFVCSLLWGASAAVAQKKDPAVDAFEKQVKDYIALRNRVKENAPKLSKDSTPEQINAYRTTLQDSLRSARPNAKRGEFFRPETAEFIRRTLKTEFQGKDRRELREQIFETETQGVVLRVNYPYAQSAELSEMPATLLTKLPQLPKELRYRFVGRNMLLVDRESDVIIDFMPDALP
jgi:hypothetical protein